MYKLYILNEMNKSIKAASILKDLVDVFFKYKLAERLHKKCILKYTPLFHIYNCILGMDMKNSLKGVVGSW